MESRAAPLDTPMPTATPIQRVLVVGTSGSGKTTVARQVAARLGLPFFASDGFYWEADWRPASDERVDRLLGEALDQPAWVLDGNFERQWEDVWPQADWIVWLDYSLPRVLWQVTKRNLGWYASQREVWSGNRMTLRHAASGVRHAQRSHARKRKSYPKYLAQLQHPCVIRLSSGRQTRAWLESLARYTP